MTLVTHLDLRLQRAAWDALDGVRGAAVALDPRDGRMLAYVERPSPDPNAWELGSPGRVAGDRALAEVLWSGWVIAPVLVAQARAHGVSLDARLPARFRASPVHLRCAARGGPRLGDIVADDCWNMTHALLNWAWMDSHGVVAAGGLRPADGHRPPR